MLLIEFLDTFHVIICGRWPPRAVLWTGAREEAAGAWWMGRCSTSFACLAVAHDLHGAADGQLAPMLSLNLFVLGCMHATPLHEISRH